MKKRGLALLLLVLSSSLMSASSYALSLEYHHYYIDDDENIVDIARMTVMNINADGLIEFKLEGGIPYLNPNNGAVSLDYEATQPSFADPSVGLLPFGAGFGLLDDSQAQLYVFSYAMMDYRLYYPLRDQGWRSVAMIMVLNFDGTDFVLQGMYHIDYSSLDSSLMQSWEYVQPSTAVKYRIIQ